MKTNQERIEEVLGLIADHGMVYPSEGHHGQGTRAYLRRPA